VTSQNLNAKLGSQVKITTRFLDTRTISARPPRQSGQWWSESTVIAASNAPSSKGNDSAAPRTQRAAPSARWRAISTDGSTAVTTRPSGS
jgi:hypothetical protein